MELKQGEWVRHIPSQIKGTIHSMKGDLVYILEDNERGAMFMADREEIEPVGVRFGKSCFEVHLEEVSDGKTIRSSNEHHNRGDV